MTFRDEKIARVFPRKTNASPDDELAFFGDPPLILPEIKKVHVSVTFSYDIPEAERLAEAWKYGFMPMAMLWKNNNGDEDPEWRKFQRMWTRPAITKAHVKKTMD